MAISDSQKIDLLWKKIGFGKTKTDTNANKKAPNEPNASNFIIKDSDIWNQSASIPATIPSANSSIANVYLDSVSGALETTEDVDALYKKAIELGAKDEGEPGQRVPTFYGCYVRDPDGNKLTFCKFG